MDSRLRLALSALLLLVLAGAVYRLATVGREPTLEEGWPVGSVEDVVALRSRDDVNVLFILVDTLRADRLGAWGYQRDTSPMLDLLASQGVRFARHLAQSSWTKCSMASLWTGLYPVRSGVLRFDDAVSEAATLPAEIFRDAGFRTGALYRNGWVSSNFGFAQGFEVYQRPVARPMRASERRDNPSAMVVGTDWDAVEDARTFLRVHRDERWFLYLHLMDVHQYLYDEASAQFGTRYTDIYDNSIRRLDHVLEQLMVFLLEEGLLKRTLVVIASDHGEGFQERGFEGHARNVYREVTEVPFIISFPFQLGFDVTVDARTENVDIWPTVLDLLGLPPLPDTDGGSLRPQILAAAAGAAPKPAKELGFAQLDQTWGRNGIRPAPMVAVAKGDFRFVSATAGQGSEELFDHAADPLEVKNVLDQHPERAERLRDAVARYLESPPAPWGDDAPKVELEEMELNQLRALGYAVP